MPEIKIFQRTDQKKKDGLYSIYLRLTIDRKHRFFYLNVSTSINSWDCKKCIVKKSDVDHHRKNEIITKFYERAQKIKHEYFLNDKILTFDEFERNFKNERYGKESFFEFCENQIKTRYPAKSETNRTYISQLTKLKQFNDKLTFKEITPEFVKSYKNYLKNVKQNNENTMYKSISMLKTFTNWAIEYGIIKENNFKNIKIKKIEGKKEVLSLQEVNQLENLYYNENLSKPTKNVLRYFLFACFTGIRYTDLKNLQFKNIKQQIIDDKKVDILDFIMHKTNINIQIPIIPRALKLIPEMTVLNQNIFRVYSNQPTNRYLKKIMKLAGINRNISFHCSRHTCATLVLSIDKNLMTVSKILGHTNIKTTQVYTRINNEVKYNALLSLE